MASIYQLLLPINDVWSLLPKAESISCADAQTGTYNLGGQNEDKSCKDAGNEEQLRSRPSFTKSTSSYLICGSNEEKAEK